MEKDWMILLQQKNQLAKVMETNEMSARYGLALTEQEAEQGLREIVAAGSGLSRQEDWQQMIRETVERSHLL